MYWPLGAPSIYQQEFPERRNQVVHDGLDAEAVGTVQNGNKHESIELSRDEPDAGKSPRGSESSKEYQNRLTSRRDGESGSVKHRTLSNAILSIASSRSGNIFATITYNTLAVWSSRPCVVLSSITRSQTSLETYGENTRVLVRPDAGILVVHSAKGFLITYSLIYEPGTSPYQLAFLDTGRRSHRRNAIQTGRKDRTSIHDDGPHLSQLVPRFRMVIKVDAGLSDALALDEELIVATTAPVAVQCIKWAADRTKSQTSTALLSRISWISSAGVIVEMTYDRPMNLYTWLFDDGHIYAVQRHVVGNDRAKTGKAEFSGYEFHIPTTKDHFGVKTCTNSKFSTIAVGCADGSIELYNVKDYLGGIVASKSLGSPATRILTGQITTMRFTPDGYLLFVGYERGWATWTVLGLQAATSFAFESEQREAPDLRWLLGVKDAFWIGGGCEIVILEPDSSNFAMLEFLRSALTGNLSTANVAKPLLQTSSGIMVYQGHHMSNLTTISADVSLWHQSQVPIRYMDEQWPLRCSAISPDGRFVAVAGQRGLAHYSVSSGRWRVFDDPSMQNSFRVRGGMCWYQHILVAAVETDDAYEIRLYSREAALEDGKILQTLQLHAPVVHIATSIDDSILVYTHENVLAHYVGVSASKAIHLKKVGQIGLHGIVRAPARVRAISWIIPDYQLQSGDPSKDVAVASILLLVDAKLVLLQPTTNDEGDPKYDMRIVSHNVEFYFLTRDSAHDDSRTRFNIVSQAEDDRTPDDLHKPEDTLQDSLWLFEGQAIKTWTDVQLLLETAPTDQGKDNLSSITTNVDFYPLSVLIPKGIVFGVEAELVHGREDSLTLFRTVARAGLFIPDILRYQLMQYDSPAALHLSHHYQNLPYFSHALEVLLHQVLDEEVENPPRSESILLPTVLSFLSSFAQYLDVVVQCTRKTEVRSWETLFSHLPPPQELFEASLSKGALKTASGYLLVLHTLADVHSTSPQVIKLLRAAKEAQDWELCKELARFLMALDESGATLEYALDLVDLVSPTSTRGSISQVVSPAMGTGLIPSIGHESIATAAAERNNHILKGLQEPG